MEGVADLGDGGVDCAGCVGGEDVNGLRPWAVRRVPLDLNSVSFCLCTLLRAGKLGPRLSFFPRCNSLNPLVGAENGGDLFSAATAITCPLATLSDSPRSIVTPSLP